MRPSRVARIPVAAALVTLAIALSACSADDSVGLTCPLLAPGALEHLEIGASLDFAGEAGAISDAVPAGQLVAHAMWLPAEATVDVTVTVEREAALAVFYGPRDLQGGFPSCLDLRTSGAPGAPVTATLETGGDGAGEYTVLVGAAPGAGSSVYEVAVSCVEGCETEAATCPTLQELGCAETRCDGQLVHDADGCPTCQCDPAALCGPDRSAGPWGTCVLPACDCSEAEGEPVCGADGQTYPTACHARCAAVPVALEGSCEVRCPGLGSCDAPCYGLRALSPDGPDRGCPTCGCAPAVRDSPTNCAACPIESEPACGSDGVTYRSRCHARCAGARILYPGACVDGCREAPAGCDLDCPWGLRLSEGSECLGCACALSPPAACDTSGAPVCAELWGLEEPTTVGSPCLAIHFGASIEQRDPWGRWGPCGTACEADEDCGEDAFCLREGPMQGRCLLLGDTPCGCAAVVDPVCDQTGTTRPNACHAWCAGGAVAATGACE